MVAVGTDPADARSRRKRYFKGGGYTPAYAAIVVDANSGKVLHGANPDSTRHPASLTKIMTLYLLFEQLEAGRLKLDSRMEVSEHAASQAPTKLGLRPGQTLAVEDAIRGLVTKSANDAAAVVAEAIAGDEDAFAQRMTRKARALGMSRTTYRNASGLPDSDQVTTARDQALLGRAIQERFPRYYRYFATPSFTYRGMAMRNHNRLLGRVEGVDGIKTGYTRASGFNLVSSVRRGNRHLVAVVLGGSSGGARDARMRTLIEEYVDDASPTRTASRIVETPDSAEARGKMRTASAAERPAPARDEVAHTAAIPQPAQIPQPTPAPTRAPMPILAAAAMPAPAGSAEPLQPTRVKTINVRPGTIQTASLTPIAFPAAPMPVPAQAPAPAPGQIAAYAPVAPAAHAAPGQIAPPPGARPGILGTLPASSAPETVAAAPAPRPSAARPMPSEPPAAQRSGWIIQVGAFPAESQAKDRLKEAQGVAKTMLVRADPFTERITKGAQELYRARFAGLDQHSAEAACKHLKRNDIACMAIRN